MQDEAEITISGVKLSHDESMTVRVAIDTLANVLAEGLEEAETRALADRYLKSLGRIQTLLESRKAQAIAGMPSARFGVTIFRPHRL